MSRFLNKYEEVTYEKLKALCDQNGAHVFAKVRVADAIPIERGSASTKDFSFALRSHLDFLVTDRRYSPLFAVEFDGPYHNREAQRGRDRIKNDLCERSALPLLRINANYLDRLCRGFDLLTYFVDVWFLNAAFEDAQRRGEIPWDEGFDPVSVISNGSGAKWPYWLSVDIHVAIERLQEQGLLRDPLISHWVGVDKVGNYRCLCWIRVPDGRFVIAETGMRAQRFPVMESDVITQVAAFEVYEKITQVLKGNDKPESESTFVRRWQFNKKSYDERAFGGYSEFQ